MKTLIISLIVFVSCFTLAKPTITTYACFEWDMTPTNTYTLSTSTNLTDWTVSNIFTNYTPPIKTTTRYFSNTPKMFFKLQIDNGIGDIYPQISTNTIPAPPPQIP